MKSHNLIENSKWDDEFADADKIIPKGTLVLIRGTWGYLPCHEIVMTEMKDIEITLEKDAPYKEAWDTLIRNYRYELLTIGGSPRLYFFEGAVVSENGIEFVFGT